MKLDIQTGIQTAFIIALLLGLISLWMGINSIRAGNRLPFFRKRRDRIVRGWRLIFVALVFGVASFMVRGYAEPVVYRVFPPSPTVTLTPTITQTPTISPTPSITLTPTITNTPSITSTPSMPQEIASKFESTITPQTEPVFSSLVFARKLDDDFQPIDPAGEFANPIEAIYGVFSYDQMTPGAQWSALWYQNGKLVYYETLPWNGGTGGYGYTQWAPAQDQWLPGTYEVQIFVGSQWVKGASGTFVVTGNPPTPIPTPSPTMTRTSTPTIGPTPTRTSTSTPTVTITPTPSKTPTITNTPTITLTPTITRTVRPTDTRRPTLTSPPVQ
jgi:hypothetical protein